MIRGILLTLVLTATAYAGPKSICGETDDRMRSYDQKIGRLSAGGEHRGCTVTMISESCGITAGHCEPALEYAEFNTPLSNDEGEAQASSPSDFYLIDQDTVQLEYTGLGNDWALVNFKRNSITNKLPGEVNGFYEVSFQKPIKGSQVIITGYGTDYDNPEKNFVQQIHSGKLESTGGIFGRKLLEYTTDTTGGNSGSSVISARTGKIIGIHTNGGCRADGGSNKGVMIHGHQKLIEAIKTCLAR